MAYDIRNKTVLVTGANRGLLDLQSGSLFHYSSASRITE